MWQFFDTSRKGTYLSRTRWQDALSDDGARQVIFLKRLILSRPFFSRRPADNIIKDGLGTGADHCVASLGKGYALVYLPTGKPVHIALDKISSTSIKAWWYNPRNGDVIDIGVFSNTANPLFSVPGISKELQWLKTGRGCDWVLVLDDASLQFSKPGG